jgi:hypothetical protein
VEVVAAASGGHDAAVRGGDAQPRDYAHLRLHRLERRQRRLEIVVCANRARCVLVDERIAVAPERRAAEADEVALGDGLALRVGAVGVEHDLQRRQPDGDRAESSQHRAPIHPHLAGHQSSTRR